jgi:beta-xylosidase
MKTLIIATFWLGMFLSCPPLYSQSAGKWGDQGNGWYANPVLPGDFSDLDAIHVGKDFYAISSTMQFSPGMAVLHSVDLVNWEIIGHVAGDLTKISPELGWERMNCYGKGIWAGSIRYYKNKFWVYFGTPDDGFFMSSATNPAGPWEPIHQVWKTAGWDDCCSFCDVDGQLYFVATNFAYDSLTQKKYNIHLFRLNPDGKSLQFETDSIIHQSQGSEANKLYQINGKYYHFFSEVKKEGRVMMMERSKNIHGPWEIKQLNHVDPKKDKEPNQGGLIQITRNQWYFFTHHGTGSWEGRTASLLPVNWVNDWPIIGHVGPDTIGQMVWEAPKPLKKKTNLRIQTSDDFDSPSLNVQWEWNYQPRSDKWSLTERKGFMRLYAFRPIAANGFRNVLYKAGNTLTQRSLRTMSNVVTTKLDLTGMTNGQHAGLTHFSTQRYTCLGIRRTGDQNDLVYDDNGTDSVVTTPGTNVVWLRSNWDVEGVCSYSYSLDGKHFVSIEKKSQLTWGSYRGDRIGIFNYNNLNDSGILDIDFFDYRFQRSHTP